jgi:hypothetical protein
MSTYIRVSMGSGPVAPAAMNAARSRSASEGVAVPTRHDRSWARCGQVVIPGQQR